MHTRPIPSTGELLPVIGCGTWQGFDVSAAPEQRAPLADVLRGLFEAGGTVVDSSPMYGPAEGVVGDLLGEAQTRDKAFIATKIWTRGREGGIRQVRRSMKRLRTERIDLLQVHNLIEWRTHLVTLRALKDDGRIRYLGVTHYTPAAHDDLEAVMRTEELDFVQLDYSLEDRAAERRLLPLAIDRGIAVVINQPFSSGPLLRYLGKRPLPVWAVEICADSWAQLLLKFVLSHPAVTCVIPGTANPEHMRENAKAGLDPLPARAFWEDKPVSIRE